MTRLLLLLLLTGCKDPPPTTPDTPDTGTEPPVALVRPAIADAPRFLRRAALDLTGGLPDPAALDRVQADPTLLDEEIAALLASPLLEERLVHLLNERWHVRTDVMPVGPEDYGLPTELTYSLSRMIGEEPLRLIAHLAAEDRPWSDIVLTDEVMATSLLTEIWPVALEDPEAADEDGWGLARWTDHRPAMGVLASNGLWWRYNTTAFNYNRTRAAAITRLLLCDDYLSRAVQFESPSLTDAEGTSEAVRTDPSCLACHATLDPLAASLFGFWSYDLYDPLELSFYHPEREPLGEDALQVAPAWFGQPLYSVSDLGPAVADDARFARCAVETLAEGLWRRPLEDADDAQLDVLEAYFAQEGQQVRALLAALTATPAYAGDLRERPDDTDAPRLLGPQQLAVLAEQTTALDWQYHGWAMLDSDTVGLRTALGGVDGIEVTAPKYAPDVVQTLAWRAVATSAAHTALDALAAGTCPLLPGATLETSPEDAAFEAAVAHAWWWLTATPPDAALLEDLAALWQVSAAAGGPEEGWSALLAALLQDPLTLSY